MHSLEINVDFFSFKKELCYLAMKEYEIKFFNIAINFETNSGFSDCIVSGIEQSTHAYCLYIINSVKLFS